jgi:hypothetical protein
MSSDELFDAVSHPIRIDIVRILVEKPLGFAGLKRELKISSSGLRARGGGLSCSFESCSCFLTFFGV